MPVLDEPCCSAAGCEWAATAAGAGRQQALGGAARTTVAAPVQQGVQSAAHPAEPEGRALPLRLRQLRWVRRARLLRAAQRTRAQGAQLWAPVSERSGVSERSAAEAWALSDAALRSAAAGLAAPRGQALPAAAAPLLSLPRRQSSRTRHGAGVQLVPLERRPRPALSPTAGRPRAAAPTREPSPRWHLQRLQGSPRQPPPPRSPVARPPPCRMAQARRGLVPQFQRDCRLVELVRAPRRVPVRPRRREGRPVSPSSRGGAEAARARQASAARVPSYRARRSSGPWRPAPQRRCRRSAAGCCAASPGDRRTGARRPPRWCSRRSLPQCRDRA